MENSVWNGLRNVRQSRGLTNDAKTQIVALKDETTQCIALDALVRFPELSVADACTLSPELAATGRSVDEILTAWAAEPAPHNQITNLLSVLAVPEEADAEA